MRTISNLTTQKNKLIADATDLVQRGLNTSEQKEQYQRLLADADEVQSDIDALAYIERKLPPELSRPTVTAPASSAATVVDSPEDRKASRDRAYRHLFKHGPQHAPEQRDLTVSNGAALIGQDFDSAYTDALKFYGPFATLVKQKFVADRGAPTRFVTSDDTASTMTYLEDASSTSGVEADPTISSTVPGTDSLVTMVKYSFQEAEDAVDFEKFIYDLAFIRASRAIEYALTLGKDNGTNTQLPNSVNGGWLAGLSAGVTQTSGELSAGPTYAQLAALAGSVDHAYYVNGSFMASPSVFNFLVTQVDTTGRPLYKFDDDGNLLIAGKKLYVNAAMPAYNAASSPIVTFGDYSRSLAYLNGGGLQIRILRERFSDALERAALIYTRLGNAALLPGAVKALVTASS